jgi:hypothetical protein
VRTPDDAEVLQHGTDDPWPWRRVAAVLLVPAVAVAVAVGVDRSERAREEGALAACAAAGDAAVDRAWQPIVAMAQYVRPTLSQVPEGSTRNGIFALVAGEAQDRAGLVAAARDGCTEVRIWWHHHDLRERRDACAATLTTEVGRLADVARDGRVAFEGATLERCG